MYVVTGASGNTGSSVAQTLLDAGAQVRLIARNPDHLRQFAARGAETVSADITDTAKLVSAFTGAKAVYAMIPPNPSTPDLFAYDERIISSLVSALTQTKVPYAVVLSSVGADKPTGTGPVLGLRQLEEALSSIQGLNALYLRAGYFMENTLAQAGIIPAMGKAAGPIRPDLKLPMIAARDIGAAAAGELLKLNFQGHQTRELLGQRDITYIEATAIIGQAIGKPDLSYTQLPNEQLLPALMNMGMSENFASLLLEMTASLNSGHMRAMEPRSPRNTTPTSFETFVKEKFLPAYQQSSAAA